MLSSKQQQQPNTALGAQGENRAVSYLISQGFRIIDVNVIMGRWEIDIVAEDSRHNELVFVEVKTRSSAFFGHPSQAIDTRKLRSLSAAAMLYCCRRNVRQTYRIDVISLTPETLHHATNITW